MQEPIHPAQLEGFKRMTAAQKLQMVADLYETEIRLRVEGLRMAHPDWPDEKLDFEARGSRGALNLIHHASQFRPTSMSPRTTRCISGRWSIAGA